MIGPDTDSRPAAAQKQESAADADAKDKPKPKPGLEVTVHIDGVEGDEKTNIEAYLDLVQKSGDPSMTAGHMKRLAKRAPLQIKEALQPFGYFSVQVEGGLSEEKEGWVARYQVTPGAKTHVAKISLSVTGPGSQEDKVKQTISAFPVKEGDVLDGDAYDKGKDKLLEVIADLGYAKAKTVVHQIRVIPEQNEAHIELEIETGPKYLMGTISFDQDVLNQDFLDRYVHLEPGDVYSQENLLLLQSDLISTQYFSVVDVKPDFDQVDELKVPVDVTMEPANRHKLEFGVGAFSDLGPVVSTEWRFRPSNRRGHYMDTVLKLSPVKSIARFGYWIPVRDPRTDAVVLMAKFVHEDSTSQKRNTADLIGGYDFLWNEWNSRLFTELKHETFTTGSQPETTTLMLSFGGTTERAWTPDESPFPQSGHYWFFDASGSAGVVSDTAYVRAHVKTKHLFPVGERGRLMLRAEVGAAKVSDFTKYPSSLRFYAGGDQSVRGYKYQDLGPLDEDGDVVGGRNVLTGTVEYDHRVLDDWVAAAFVDAGNSFNETIDKVYYAGGVGIRWLSPVGSVRLDFAVPINKEDNMDSWRVHFGFGAEL
jgi:translocation and assembly module TamA